MLKRPSVQFFDNAKIKASPSALKFLRDIDIDDLEYFMYSDNLVHFTDLSTDVGKYECYVKKSCYDLTPCLKVKIKNDIALSGIICQTKVVCYIGQNLRTLHQTFEEILQFPDYKMNKKVVITEVSQGYEVLKETSENEIEENTSRFFSKSMMEGYVSEGACILLHRILISRKMPDNFTTMAFNQYWELSSASYKVLDNLKLPIQDENVDVVGIERIVYSSDDYETIWQMYFVPDGHLMSKAQVGSPISMKVKEVTDYVKKDTFLNKPTFDVTKLIWEDDVQLISQFLDMKEVNKSKSIKYLKDHVEIKLILQDFMQSVLIRKPKNPIDFASRYFVTFSSRVKPNYRYQNSNATNTDFLI